MARIRRRLGLALATSMLTASAIAAPVAAAAPPTLTGVVLVADPIDVQADCDPAETSTISWSASGTAFGTYPGTFVETGTATVGPHTLLQYVNGFQLGPVVTADVFFVIDSPVGQVVGSKRLVVPSPTDWGACYDFENRPLPPPSDLVITGTFRRLIPLDLTYEATIATPEGTFLDSGTSGLLLEEFHAVVVSGTGSIGDADVINEGFTSSQSGVVTATPGRTTGGGRVGDVTFGYTAGRDNSGPKGRCAVVDRESETMVRCLDVTAIAVSGNEATFYGNALVGDTATRYRIHVVDADESGAGADSWSISTLSGYQAGGVLTEGNVQVRS
jgi:hypothetical protein